MFVMMSMRLLSNLQIHRGGIVPNVRRPGDNEAGPEILTIRGSVSKGKLDYLAPKVRVPLVWGVISRGTGVRLQNTCSSIRGWGAA